MASKKSEESKKSKEEWGSRMSDPIWDVDLMELDPVIEIEGQKAIRKLEERRMPEFNVAKVVLFRALMLMVECSVPNCEGHRKYGATMEDNRPVVFRRHYANESPIYSLFKSQVNRPIRVPETGEALLMGIKWKATEMSMLLEASKTLPCVFDCLLADLRLRMMLKEFCLECLFAHSNGKGLLLERFIKTVLYHIVPFGRSKDKGQFVPLRSYDKRMEIKFRRIYWGLKAPKITANSVSLKEHVTLGSPEKPIRHSKGAMFEGHFADPQTGILRNLDSITLLNVLVKCKCYGGQSMICQVYCGLLKKVLTAPQKSTEYNISLAKWLNDGDEYEDPIWNYSMLGDDTPTGRFNSKVSNPISRFCEKCSSHRNIVTVQVPNTTWLLMADLDESLKKVSVKSFRNMGYYQVGGVAFYPAFVLVYNTTIGSYTTLSLVGKDEWRFFNDLCGGLLRSCDPDKVKYGDKVNLRVFFYRKTEINPHACLSRAATKA